MVDRVSTEVECRDSGGRRDQHIAIGDVEEPADQCGLSGPSLAREEQAAPLVEPFQRLSELIGEDESTLMTAIHRPLPMLPCAMPRNGRSRGTPHPCRSHGPNNASDD